MNQAAPIGHFIYLVDGDAAMSRLVAVNLEARGYRVRHLDNGPSAIAYAQQEEPDLVVLDMDVPAIGGLELITEFRRHYRIPIMVLSIQDETAARVSALEAGADIYLVKPFQIEEVIARIHAMLRRTSPAGRAPIPAVYSYRCGDLSVDLETMRVTVGGEQINLTPREWGLLQVLIKHAGRVVSTRQLL